MLDQPSRLVDMNSTEDGFDPILRATNDRASSRDGSMVSLPVDPATTDPEGKQTADWDSVTTTERIARTERAIADTLREMKAATPEDTERYRQRALMTLSAARADFLSTKTGAERYEQLERELEGE